MSVSQPSLIANCTHRCNLECPHCYCSGSPSNTSRLSQNDLASAFNDLSDFSLNHPPFFDLTGGEFVLLDDADAISQMVRKKFPNTCIIVETNGIELLNGTDKYDRIEFDRIHLSVDRLHTTLFADGTSPVLKEALKYRDNRRFELVINYIPELNEVEMPSSIAIARASGIRVNVFPYDTLARIGRGSTLRANGPGVSVADNPGFFRCELGEALFLDGNKNWYLCHFPTKETDLGRIGSPGLSDRYQEALKSKSYRSLRSEGLPSVYRELSSEINGRIGSNPMGRLFHNRCEPCLLLQDKGLITFVGDHNGTD